MTRYLFPENRLRKAIRAARGGGITIEGALARADANLESVRDDVLGAVREKVRAIVEVASSIGAPESVPILRRVSLLANDIFSEAGAFGLADLSVAAHSLCDLINGVHEKPVNAEALRVHVEAMVLLATPNVALSESMRTSVLDGLHRVSKRFAEHEE